jgi:predicted methyltransferase
MPGTRLFNPADSLSIRDPVSNEQMNGNVMNPPRFAELGGLSGRTKAFFKNAMRIVKPGAGTRNEPIS